MIFQRVFSQVFHETAPFPTLNQTSVTTRAKNLNPFQWRSNYPRLNSKPNLTKRQGRGDGIGIKTVQLVLRDTCEGGIFFGEDCFFFLRVTTS